MPSTKQLIICFYQGLLLHSCQCSEGPPGVQMDPHPAALLRDRPKEGVLPLPGVLHGQITDQHHDQPWDTGGM